MPRQPCLDVPNTLQNVYRAAAQGRAAAAWARLLATCWTWQRPGLLRHSG